MALIPTSTNVKVISDSIVLPTTKVQGAAAAVAPGDLPNLSQVQGLISTATTALPLTALATQAALSVVANGTNATAAPTALAAATDGFVLRRSGTALVWGLIVAANITAATLTKATLAADVLTSVVINAQTGTGYTLVLSDAGALVTLTNAASITLTVPLNSAVAYPVGTVITLSQRGAGQVAVAPTGGVTLNSYLSMRKIAGQYAQVSLVKLATDTWDLTGQLVV